MAELDWHFKNVLAAQNPPLQLALEAASAIIPPLDT